VFLLVPARIIESKTTKPVIHLVRSTKTDTLLPSLGQFDLLDPTSALYFGQFILGLHHHFTSLQEWSKDRRTLRDYCWRLDHVDQPCVLPRPKLDVPINNQSLVETWLSGLPVARNKKYVAPINLSLLATSLSSIVSGV
jgi:hypothetical protein